jgi:hypothetical protein
LDADGAERRIPISAADWRIANEPLLFFAPLRPCAFAFSSSRLQTMTPDIEALDHRLLSVSSVFSV